MSQNDSVLLRQESANLFLWDKIFYIKNSWKLKNLDSTGDDAIYEAYQIAKDAGLKYVYVGNIPGDQKENTYCPGCSELAIRRFGLHIERLDSKGACSYCDRSLDIIE